MMKAEERLSSTRVSDVEKQQTRFIPLQAVLKTQHEFSAHRKDDGEVETLRHHTERAEYYWSILMENSGAEDVLDRLFKKFRLDNRLKDFFGNVFTAVVTFHDSGKINPAFQKEKMKIDGPETMLFAGEGSNHSLYSAFLFTVYFYAELIQIDQEIHVSDEDWNLCSSIIDMMAYVISRHHSDLDTLESFYEKRNTAFQLYRENEKIPENIFSDEFLSALPKVAWTIQWPPVLEDLQTRRLLMLMSRLAYSLLVASDYYATSEFMSGGFRYNLAPRIPEKMKERYHESDLFQMIRKTPRIPEEEWGQVDEINRLRSDLFYEVSENMKCHPEKRLYFLEAPTGSGKSNVALNFALENIHGGKIFYIFPYNTLVEQNTESLRTIYGEETFDHVSVINSLTPIPVKKNPAMQDGISNYRFIEEALMDRQFLNYPMIITTHVGMFQTLFGKKRESILPYMNLINSVLVFDEVQSYSGDLWQPFIEDLSLISEIMNMKVLFMSATLPDLSVFLANEDKEAVLQLIGREYRKKLYEHPLFRKRVTMNRELIDKVYSVEMLWEHVLNHTTEDEKIIIEFLSRREAETFYRQNKDSAVRKVYLMTGEDSILDRKRIVKKFSEDEGFILVSTQVIEAGLDIDADVGYKDYSSFDLEEQFMGRVNRSCRKNGRVYFFTQSNAKTIYRDVKMSEQFTLKHEETFRLLEEKRFDDLYRVLLEVIKERGEDYSSRRSAISEAIKKSDFRKLDEHYKLIPDDTYRLTYFFNRFLICEGETLDGHEIWNSYKRLLHDKSLKYAEREIFLSEVKAKMNYFMYELYGNEIPGSHDDEVGTIRYIEDGDVYFDDEGKLNHELLSGNTLFY